MDNTELENDKIITDFTGIRTPFNKKDFNCLIEAILAIGEKTGFTLSMTEGECYWVCNGNYPPNNSFTGYTSYEGIYKAILEMCLWWPNYISDENKS